MRNLAELGNEIAKIREQREFTQEGLAEKIGCQPNSLSRWENGNTAMKIDMFAAIIDALEVSADDLLGIGKRENHHNQEKDKEASLNIMLQDLTPENLYMLQNILKVMMEAIKTQQN